MTDPQRPPGSTRSTSVDTAADVAVGLGVLLALAGLVVGLVMALDTAGPGCVQGFDSCTHPRALEGTAVMLLSALLGLVLLLLWLLVTRSRRPAA